MSNTTHRFYKNYCGLLCKQQSSKIVYKKKFLSEANCVGTIKLRQEFFSQIFRDETFKMKVVIDICQ